MRLTLCVASNSVEWKRLAALRGLPHCRSRGCLGSGGEAHRSAQNFAAFKKMKKSDVTRF
jgi:hypothetical protein